MQSPFRSLKSKVQSFGVNGPRRFLDQGREFWFCLAVLLGIASSSFAAAYPPNGLPITWSQPDGTKVALRVIGNEFYARTETADGYTVLFEPTNRTYYYATLGPDGTTLVQSRTPAGQAPPAALPKSLLESKAKIAAFHDAMVRQLVPDRAANWAARVNAVKRQRARAAGLLPSSDSASESVNEAAAEAALAAPITGTRVGLMIIVQFPDDPATGAGDAIPFPTTSAKVQRYANTVGYNDDGNTGSIRDYYYDQSNGLLTFTQSVTAVVTLPHPFNYYNYSNYPTNTALPDCGVSGRLIVADAVAALKTGGFDFSSLSVDSSNRVYATSLLFAGENSGVFARGLWPHSSAVSQINVGTTSSPRYIYRYQCTNVPTAALVIGTNCHELGHLLCGYPDLYDIDQSSEGVGEHSIMGSGNYQNDSKTPSPIDLYLKDYTGWANITDLTPTTALSTALPSTGNVGYRIRKPGTATEYFLIENRGAGDKWATYTPDRGLIIWHVDETVADNTQEAGTPTQHYLLAIEQADGLFDLEQDRNRGDAGDCYDSTTATFTDSSTPSARWWSGASSGISIAALGSPGASMSVRFGSSSTNVLTVNPATQLADTAGGTYSFAVTSNITWTWSSNAAWVTSSEAITQTGNQTFTYTVAANTTGSSRTGTLTLTGGGITQTHVITQPASSGVNLTTYVPSGWSAPVVISNVTGTNTDSSPLLPTDTLYLDYAVFNSGTTATSGNFDLTIEVDGVLQGPRTHTSSVAAGAGYTNTDVNLGSLAAGTHTIRFTIDSGNAIAESNENDNVYIKTIMVGTGPNLAPYQPAGWSDEVVVSNVTGTNTDSATLLPTDTLYLDYAVFNSGTQATSGSFQLTIEIDGTVSNTLTHSATLAAGTGYTNADVNLGSLAAGAHTIRFTIDSGNAIAESNENDNVYIKTIVISNPAAPNLAPYQPAGWSDEVVVSNVTGTNTDSATLLPTDTLYLDYAVFNSGTQATSGGFQLTIEIDGAVSTTLTHTTALAAGTGYTNADVNLGSLAAGTHTIRFTIDSANAIAETNEGDNVYTKTIIISDPAAPNLTTYLPAGWSDRLVVSNVTGTNTDSPVLSPTDTLYLDYAVSNTGTVATSGNFDLTIEVDGVLQPLRTHTSSVGAGMSYTNTDVSLGSLAVGVHTIRFTIDSGNAIAESNENDNVYIKTITVTSLDGPNLTTYKPAGWSDRLVVSNVTGTNTDSPVLLSTDTLYLDYAVFNSGTAATVDDFALKIEVDGAVYTTLTHTSPVAAGTGYTNADVNLGSLASGTHTIRFTVDSGNAIAETDETDNVYTKTITVLGGSGYRLTLQSNPSSAGTITASPQPGTGGTYPAGTVVSLSATPSGSYVFGNWSGDASGSRQPVQVTMNGDRSVTANFTTQPTVHSGTYYGLIRGPAGEAPLHEHNGYVTIAVTRTGAFTATAVVGGVRKVVRGSFDPTGTSHTLSFNNRITPLYTMVLRLDPLDPDGLITADVDFVVGTGSLTAKRLVFNARTNPASIAGRYTFVATPTPTASPDMPQAPGAGTVIVGRGGIATVVATLSDGTVFARSSGVAADGTWPFYGALNRGRGFIGGWMTFGDLVDSDAAGVLDWVKPPVARTFFDQGFTTQCVALLSQYKFERGVLLLPFGEATRNASVTLGGGDLPELPGPELLTLSLNGRVTNAVRDGFVFALRAGTGLFSGSFRDPETNRPHRFQGALMQKQGIGTGFFRGTEQTGSVLFSSSAP